jgi:hypothetical protein
MSIKLYENKIKEYQKSGYGKALAWELELIKTHKIN